MTTATELDLHGELTIYRARELKAALSQALAEADRVTIGLAHVTELDSAGLQLLMAAQRAAASAGKSFHLVHLSTAAQDALQLFDLAPCFKTERVEAHAPA